MCLKQQLRMGQLSEKDTDLMNVLIIEYSKTLRETIEDALTKMGYGVDAVGDGKRISNNTGEICVINHPLALEKEIIDHIFERF